MANHFAEQVKANVEAQHINGFDKAKFDAQSDKIEAAVYGVYDNVKLKMATMKTAIGMAYAEMRTEGEDGVTWKRKLVAYVASFVAGFGIGYAAGTLIEYVIAASVVHTGSMFLGIVAAVIIAIAALYLSMKAGQKIAGYIAFGDIDADIKKMKHWLSNKLQSAEPITVAQ